MVLQFLQAYAELVAAVVAAKGPIPDAPTGVLKTDVSAAAAWLRHIELNIPHYEEYKPATHAAVVAVMTAWKQWNDAAAIRQAVCELFLDAVKLYYRTSGDTVKSCTLTEMQALLLYQRGLLDCGAELQTYAEWKAAGKVFGIDFGIGSGFWLDG